MSKFEVCTLHLKPSSSFICNEECRIYLTTFEGSTIVKLFHYHQNLRPCNIRIYAWPRLENVSNKSYRKLGTLTTAQCTKEKRDTRDHRMKRPHCFNIWNTNCTIQKLWIYFALVEKWKKFQFLKLLFWIQNSFLFSWIIWSICHWYSNFPDEIFCKLFLYSMWFCVQ